MCFCVRLVMTIVSSTGLKIRRDCSRNRARRGVSVRLKLSTMPHGTTRVTEKKRRGRASCLRRLMPRHTTTTMTSQVFGPLLPCKRAPGVVMDPRSVASVARKGICRVTVRVICPRFDAFVAIKQGISGVTVLKSFQ